MEHLKIYVKDDFSALPSYLEDEKELYLIYDSNLEKYSQEIIALLSGSQVNQSATQDSPKSEAMSLGTSAAPKLPAVHAMAIDTSEALKTMDSVMAICRFLLDHGASRKAMVLALGGGITTDMAGFAASIYKRGVRFANLPTTLLAQVDAAIGGKTGVNMEGFKNILGVINQPEFTYISSHVLKTLSQKDLGSGIAEMLKTFILCDAHHYEQAVESLKKGGIPKRELIEAAAYIKAGVVERDEKETGERRTLNLGHSVAHAIEWWQSTCSSTSIKETASATETTSVSDANGSSTSIKETTSATETTGVTSYSHGEAVAIGTVQAAVLSERLGVCAKGLAARLKADFEAVGLPTECPISADTIDRAIRQDKKAEGAGIHFILIKTIGEVEDRMMSIDEVIEGLR